MTKYRYALVQQDAGCCAVFRNEFRKDNFWFTHNDRKAFYKCQWPIPPGAYLLYRTGLAMYLLFWLLYTAISFEGNYSHSWPCWLTNWSFTVLTLYALVAFAVATYMQIKCHGLSLKLKSQGINPESDQAQLAVITPGLQNPGFGGPMDLANSQSTVVTVDYSNPSDTVPLGWYIKMQWLLFTIISNFAFVVTAIYFGAIYPPNQEYSTMEVVSDFQLHAVNSLVIIIEMFMTGMPVKLLHVIYPVVYGAAYLLFSFFYWLHDKSNVIYNDVLDWNHLGQTMIVILVVVIFIFIVQFMLFGIFKLRQILFRRLVVGSKN